MTAPAGHPGPKSAARRAALLQELGGDPRSDAGRVLDAAGDLLRRGESLGLDAADLAAVDRALAAIPPESARAAIAAVDLDGERERLGRAIDQAMEVSLAEGEAERGRAARTCVAALAARDRLSSRAVAARRLEEALKMELGDGLGAGLAEIDRALRLKARCLVGLNAERRAALEELDPERREDAWWYSARSSCDGLVDALAGGEIDAHVAACGECQADLGASGSVDRAAAARRWRSSAEAPAHHVTAAELWRYDIGVMTPDERRFLDRHADGCPRCAQALWAFQDGERAVDEIAAQAAPACDPDRPDGGRGR